MSIYSDKLSDLVYELNEEQNLKLMEFLKIMRNERDSPKRGEILGSNLSIVSAEKDESALTSAIDSIAIILPPFLKTPFNLFAYSCALSFVS